MHFVYLLYIVYFLNLVVCRQVSERPRVQRFEAKTAFFRDGSQAEVDVVVMCTGYLHAYPFLRYPSLDVNRLPPLPTPSSGIPVKMCTG